MPDHLGPPLSGEEPRKKRRRRVTAATCEQCTRRKQRCNKEIPCNHCIARGIPDQCRLYIPKWSPTPEPETRKTASPPSAQQGGDSLQPYANPIPGHVHFPSPPASSATGRPSISEDVTFKEEIRARMQRIEDLLLGSVGSLPSLPGARQPNGVSFVPGLSGVDQGVRVPPPSGSALARNSIGSDAEFVAASALVGGPMQGLPARGSVSSSHGQGILAGPEPPCPLRLRQACSIAGIPPTNLTALLTDLPDQGVASRIVDTYFRSVNALRYPIREARFWYPMDDLYDKQRTPSDDLDSFRHLPLVFIVLAIGVLNAPEEVVGSEADRRKESLRLYWAARRAALYTSSLQPESLELAIAGLLTGMYPLLGHDRPLVEGWAQLGEAIRIAVAIGLHHDGSRMGLTSLETEYRRRIWSYFLHADRHYAMLLGRPPAVAEPCFQYDTLEPSNIDLDTLLPSQPIVSKPLWEPTSSTFLILQRRLADITAQVIIVQANQDKIPYDKVLALDDRIQTYIDTLPPHFRLVDADTSHDQSRKYLPLQRHTIGSEICFARILLHRPWLLRRSPDDRYSPSRRACFDAAKLDFRLRQRFLEANSGRCEQFFAAQFIEFNSAVVAGIAAVTQPRASDAEDMRIILSTFLNRYPMDKEVTQAISASQREVAVIYALYQRSLQLVNSQQLDATLPQPIVSRPSSSGFGESDGLAVETISPDTANGSNFNGGMPGNGAATRESPMLTGDMFSAVMGIGADGATPNPATGKTPSITFDPAELDWLGSSQLFDFPNDSGNVSATGTPGISGISGTNVTGTATRLTPSAVLGTAGGQGDLVQQGLSTGYDLMLSQPLGGGGPVNYNYDPNPVMRWANSTYYQ